MFKIVVEFLRFNIVSQFEIDERTKLNHGLKVPSYKKASFKKSLTSYRSFLMYILYTKWH